MNKYIEALSLSKSLTPCHISILYCFRALEIIMIILFWYLFYFLYWFTKFVGLSLTDRMTTKRGCKRVVSMVLKRKPRTDSRDFTIRYHSTAHTKAACHVSYSAFHGCDRRLFSAGMNKPVLLQSLSAQYISE